MGLFLFSANIIALSANLLTGAGVLISNPRSFNARVFAGVTLSSACYLLGRTSYAVPATAGACSAGCFSSYSAVFRLVSV
jgi:hypothetical protein